MRPVVSDTTERLYARMPAMYRDADEQQPDGDNGYPFLRFISALVDQLGELEDLVDRIDYIPEGDGGAAGDTSDLVDPEAADIAWLVWLGQLVGVTVSPKLTEQEARDAVLYASAGWRAANKPAVASAAKSELTGTRFAQVFDHQTDLGPGGPFDLLIVTLTEETPSIAAVLEAVERKGAKPAGAVLHHRAYAYTFQELFDSGRTFQQVKDDFTTFDDLRTYVPPEELA